MEVDLHPAEAVAELEQVLGGPIRGPVTWRAYLPQRWMAVLMPSSIPNTLRSIARMRSGGKMP